MVKVIKPGILEVHTTECPKCKAILEYTEKDVEYTEKDVKNSGEYRVIYCPDCYTFIVVK